jgi:hypothetical protein
MGQSHQPQVSRELPTPPKGEPYNTAKILKALNKGSVANRCIILDVKAAQADNLVRKISASPIEQMNTAIKTNLDILGSKTKEGALAFKNDLDSMQLRTQNLTLKQQELKQEYDKLLAGQKTAVNTLVSQHERGEIPIKKLVTDLKDYQTKINNFMKTLVKLSDDQVVLEQQQHNLFNRTYSALPSKERATVVVPETARKRGLSSP